MSSANQKMESGPPGDQDEKDHKLGEVVELVPPTLRALVYLMFFVVIFTMVFISQVKYSKKESIVGRLAVKDRSVALVFPYDGSIASIEVQNGQEVKVNDLLAVIYRDSTLIGGGTVSEASLKNLGNARSLIEDSKAQLENRIGIAKARLEQELKAIEGNLASDNRGLKEQLARHQTFYKRFLKLKELQESKSVTKFEVDNYRTLLVQSKEQILFFRKSIESHKISREQAKIEYESAVKQIEERRTELETNVATLERDKVELAGQKTVEVRATASGTISQLTSQVGDPAQAGRPFLILKVPTSQLEGELFVSAKNLPFIEVGAPLHLTIDAFPQQQYGMSKATVREIQQLKLSANELDSLGLSEVSYRVYLDLEEQSIVKGKQTFEFKDGMSVSTKIAMNERTLLNWVLEPIKKSLKMSK